MINMTSHPAIILVEPQLVENIGMTARAMMNTGLTDLRLVDPRDKWPLEEVHQKRMAAASSGCFVKIKSVFIVDGWRR